MKKILLAEDDKFINRAYTNGLTRAKFDMISVYDGQEALKKIKSEKPDLILLNLIMPIKNGFEVMEEIKLDNKINKIPIFVLSSLGQELDIEKSKSLGAIDYLIKSNFSIKEIIDKINFFFN